MASRFAELAFTPHVRAEQARRGSRAAYERLEKSRGSPRDRLGPDEIAFLEDRDSFYVSTVSETGWPYVQHRGGPPGFVKVLDAEHLGFADVAGNRQYVTVGNLATNDRVAMFFMDYPAQQRLKILGHARLVDPEAEPALLAKLRDPREDALVERGIVVKVAALDWNCPQHITPRFTAEEVERAVEPLRKELAEARAELARLRAATR